MLSQDEKRCECCDQTAISGERFCARHRKALMEEMYRAGYFTRYPCPTRRSRNGSEASDEDDGYTHNAIRAMEECFMEYEHGRTNDPQEHPSTG